VIGCDWVASLGIAQSFYNEGDSKKKITIQDVERLIASRYCEEPVKEAITQEVFNSASLTRYS
jgi:hypothetical protein